MAATSDSSVLHLTRVYDAPVRAVWDAWTIPDQVAQWWGPRGFTLTTHSKDLRAGGHWRYTMHGPDGTDYLNVTTYFEVEPHRKLVYDHGGSDDRPPLFRVTVTFTETDGKTTMEVRSALPSPEAAVEMARFIKQAGGNGTWDRLAEHLERGATGNSVFVVTRTFEAPVARVLAAWTDPDQLARWLPPAGTRMRFLRADIAAGRSSLFVISGEHGTMHVSTEYLAVEPRRIVYVQRFVDEHGRAAPAPGADVWPAALLHTVSFVEEGNDHTRVTVRTEPYQDAARAEIDAFVGERPGMTLGWEGSFDALEGVVRPALTVARDELVSAAG